MDTADADHNDPDIFAPCLAIALDRSYAGELLRQMFGDVARRILMNYVATWTRAALQNQGKETIFRRSKFTARSTARAKKGLLVDN